MDRKGWIILILCGIGFVLTFKSMNTNRDNQNKIAEQQRLLDEQEKGNEGEGTSETGATDGEGGTESSAIPVIETDANLEEKLYTLTTKDENGGVVEYTFTNKGGGVRAAKMLTASKGPDGEEVIINQYNKQAIGALAEDEGDFANITYPADLVQVSENSITFKTKLKSGLGIVKTWSLEADDVSSHQYRLKLQLNLQNLGEGSLKLKDYAVTTGITAPLFQDERADLSKWFYYEDGDYESGGSGPFTDGWFGFSKAREIDPHAVQNLEYAGVSNQFYTTIIMPESEAKRIWVDDVTVRLNDQTEDLRSYVVGVQLPDHDLIKGSGSQTYTYKFYTGPRKQSAVSELTSHSNKTMSYGFFGFGAPLANTLLNWIHDTLGVKIHAAWSWGIAIVILTILVRLAIWPLTNKATRTMKRMGKLAPLMKEIRAEHGDNPQKVQQETMKLYRKYKVNPFGGCLPILIQMPIFFAVFGMLTNAVELRGQGFLWVQDLSQQEDIWTISAENA